MDSSRFAELSVIFSLCSGGSDVPRDQSKVNVDCVCFNLSVLCNNRKTSLTQQSNLFLRRSPTVPLPPPSLFSVDVMLKESLTQFTPCRKEEEVLPGDTRSVSVCLHEPCRVLLNNQQPFNNKAAGWRLKTWMWG